MELTPSALDLGRDDNFLAQGAAASQTLSQKTGEGAHKSSLAFRTISEVAAEIDVPQHVLRFWESRFSQLKPLKRGGGRRYYRPEDVELLSRIKNLLYKQGYTIKGVQRLLKENRAMAQSQAQAAALAPKNFVPYAHPLANQPSYPLQPVLLNSAAALHAAPSAIAMAYGVVSSTIHREAQQARDAAQKSERFADAFAGAVTQICDEAAPAMSRAEQSLDAVTQIRDDITRGISPLRVDANAEGLDEAIHTLKAEDDGTPELDLSPLPDQAAPAHAAGELKALLAELTSLRDMLNAA